MGLLDEVREVRQTELATRLGKFQKNFTSYFGELEGSEFSMVGAVPQVAITVGGVRFVVKEKAVVGEIEYNLKVEHRINLPDHRFRVERLDIPIYIGNAVSGVYAQSRNRKKLLLIISNFLAKVGVL